MPLPDYQELVFRLQRGLALTWSQFPDVLNLPGRSVACKIDAHYYLAPQPLFDQSLARWAALRPETVAQVLVKTGNVITSPPEREHVVEVSVWLEGRVRPMAASFVDAEFVDRALKVYAGQPSGLSLSDLRLAQESAAVVEKLFANKTPPGKLAWK